MDKPRFSIIVPVYNRIDEVRDLMASLDKQSLKNFSDFKSYKDQY